ncbi:hypothetical protein L1049_012547 [Liquidambar formosana]|uniref:Uncharacterized protein n=1 Tax=Liquidambar formosana TaxID=63359 RepID=A0AAP0N6J7_LIQFO
MDGSKIHEDVNDDRVFRGHVEFLDLNCRKNVTSQGLFELLKFSMLAFLINGADRVFKDRKLLKTTSLVMGRNGSVIRRLAKVVGKALLESKEKRSIIRVEFLSANGKVTAASSYPLMLRFKSQPIRFVETFLKSAPLIAGFQSESQILNIKMSDFTEGLEPTACLKVILEQRAEYLPGAGIPEIYAASLALESELPQLKRIIWSWRRTIFVWTSMISFLAELVFILVFCRPIIIPRGKPSIASAKKDPHPNTVSWYKRG